MEQALDPVGNASRDARSVLAACLHAASRLEGVDAHSCADLQQRIDEDRFSLVVVGEFNRGKSSLINALLGRELLPSAVIPLTSVLTLVRHGDEPSVSVRFEAAPEREVALQELAQYVTERGNPHNALGVAEVEIRYPSPWLGAGIRLVDTPGIGSVHGHNTEVTRRFVPQADAVLFVASAEQPLSRVELDFLADIRAHAGRVVCVLNKADLLSPGDLREALDFAHAALGEALGPQARILALSAREALAAQAAGDPAWLERSGVPALQALLQHLLGEERLAVWTRSLAGAMQRLLAQARLRAGIELQSLQAPLERTRARMEMFERRQAEATRALNDDDVLLAAEVAKLMAERVEPALQALVRDVQASVIDDIGRFCEDHRAMGARPMQDALEALSVQRLRAAFDAWRAAREADLAQAFEALDARFRLRVEVIADGLSKDAADLFELPYEAVRGAAALRVQARVRYKFWNEPASLVLLGATVLGHLPRALARPLLRRRAMRRAEDLVDMQAGRVRHAFAERIKAAGLELRKQLRAALQATIAAIGDAADRGCTQQARGETEAASRRAALEHTLAEIDTLAMRLRELQA